ncbi:MAG: PKD domain-containing protein [Armatimonadota bacterium]
MTRLDDPVPGEPGTFRYAVEEVEGPRIIVFRVGGVIRLTAPLSYLKDSTIAGQTAPGDGIVIDGQIQLASNNIVRYIRVRHGEQDPSGDDCLLVWNGADNIIDHCSLSWASSHNIGMNCLDKPANATVQWCISAEGRKGAMSFRTHNVTYHHNLFASDYERNPRVGGFRMMEDPYIYTDAQPYDLRNNVVYNVGVMSHCLTSYAQANVVGCYFKAKGEERLYRYSVNLKGSPPPEQQQLYLADISGPHTRAGEPEWNEVTYYSTSYSGTPPEGVHRAQAPIEAPPVTTHGAETAYELVLANAGATIPRRDAVDERVVQDVLAGTGPDIADDIAFNTRNWAAQQWATLSYESGTPPDDSDHDGMPDSWETEHGLDPNDASDGPGYDLDAQYTNVEVYLNSLVPDPPAGNHQPSADAGPDQEVSAGSSAQAEVTLDGSGSSDPDGDPLTYRWTWEDAEGNSHEATGVNPTISLTPGETVVTLVVNDGSLNSVPDTTTITVTADNAPPPAPEVSISPDAPTTSDDLTVTAECTDPDGDDVTYSYQWFRDGTHQPDYDDETTVPAAATKKGDTWKCVVTPSDGTAEGPTGEAQVTIANSPPTRPAVELAPRNPRTIRDVTVTADDSTDPDDDQVTYSYRWFRDGEHQPDYDDETTVPAAATTRDEIWKCVVTPSDGIDEGPSGEDKVTIANSAPTAPAVSISPTSPTTRKDLVATADGTTDPDDDPVTYSYVWYRDGEHEQDYDDETTVPAAATTRDEIWKCVVTPSDGTDEGPSGEDQVTIANSAPSAPTVSISPGSPTTRDDLVASASGSTDPDEDTVSYDYAWYKDGTLQDNATDKTVSAELTDDGQRWRVVVTPTDGDAAGESAEAVVTIGNAAPTAPTVSIEPDPATTLDDLVASADGSTDPDGDEIAYAYAWYVDGVLERGLTEGTVPSDVTSKGQTWRVVVTPTDGKSTGESGEAEVTIGNSPPTAPTVALSPSSPTASDDLVASADGSTDPDGDAVSYDYAWYRDGTLQEDLAGKSVSASLTGQAETWRVVVTPSDGTDRGEAAEASVTIQQTYAISGTVAYPDGSPVAGVLVTDGDGTAVTDDHGQYTLTGLRAGELSISASKDGHVLTPQVQKVTVPPDATEVDFKAHQLFRHHLLEGVSFVGVPCEPLETDPSAVWDTELIARWDPLQSKYVLSADANSDLLTVQPGRGYFLKSPARDLTVPGMPVSAAKPFSLTVEPGWNMVANMFGTSLAFGNLIGRAPDHVHPYAFAYDSGTGNYLLITSVSGANVDRNDVLPWEGLWLYNHGSRAKLEISPPQTASSQDPASTAGVPVPPGVVVPQAAVGGDRGWLLPIEVEAGSKSDTMTVVGTSSLLAEPVEICNPPSAPESVDLYIVGPDGRQLAQCVRNGVGAGSWQLVVSTDLPGAEVSVSLPDLSQIPDDMSVYLTDLDANERLYARTMRRYRYVAGQDGGQRRFKLEVVRRQHAGLVLTAAAASQGPQAVAVQYTVSRQCEVSARVLNIAGRTVRVLARGVSAMSGANTLSWNLRSDTGTTVASGCYIIELTARSRDGQQTHAITTATVRR